VELFEGILEDGMVMVCAPCAENEGIPMVRKPSPEQIAVADERVSVRERMERMSGMKKIKDRERLFSHGDLAKLKIPAEKQRHEEVCDNYYWELNIARRRKKMSLKQLSETVGIDSETLESIEKGVIPVDFRTVFLKLESFLGIRMLKKHEAVVGFRADGGAMSEEDILRQVREKMKSVDVVKIKEKKMDDIESGEIDLSGRQNLQDITLNDLVDRKRKKEKAREKMRERSMIGDEVEIDIDDL
jgi:ribosome-binding protein aMBF1 (putative translation factor)